MTCLSLLAVAGLVLPVPLRGLRHCRARLRPELVALHDPQDEGGHLVVVLLGVPDHGPDRVLQFSSSPNRTVVR